MGYSLKTLSIRFRGGALIFEGLRKILIYANEIFCNEFGGVPACHPRLPDGGQVAGRNPQRPEHCGIQWNFFEISPFGNTPSLVLIYVHKYVIRDTRSL
jgi:hypothetical protein